MDLYSLSFDRLYISCDFNEMISPSVSSNKNWSIVFYDRDLSWSAAALDVSHQLKASGISQLLTSFEDILPVSIDENLYDQIKSLDSYAYVRTIGSNALLKPNPLKRDAIRTVGSTFPYLGSMLLSFWDMDNIIKILSSPEVSNVSPWLYERKCHLAFQPLVEIGTVYNTTRNVFRFYNICKKGKIDRFELAMYYTQSAINQYSYSMITLKDIFSPFSLPRNFAILVYRLIRSTLTLFGFLRLKYYIFHR